MRVCVRACAYHSNADGIIKLVHEHTDDSGREEQQDERVLELEREAGRETKADTGKVSYILLRLLS